jgi:hypothetical protein
MTVPEGNLNSPDTLIIPLTTVIKKLRYRSGFNASDMILILISFLFLYIIYSFESRHAYYMKIWAWSGIYYVILAIFIFAKIHFSKIALHLFESGSTVITLNSQGFEFPVMLLVKSYTRDSLLNTGRLTIKLAWEDITSWRVFYASKSSPAHYVVRTKNAIPTPGGDYVNTDFFIILRYFSKKEEKSLLDFAQRFLPIKIKKPWFF